MLGKEDVLLWFKDLESYKRIDVMYELLNMCIPFEIRFLGSCIEEIGKHTYQELRGPSIIANDVERLAKDPTMQVGLTDETTRHRAVIYMSVLTARNCSCANWYYRTLFRTTDPIEQVVKVANKEDSSISNAISELLLLYTIGQYHPAFTFEQKDYFHRALNSLITYYNAFPVRNQAQDALPNVHTSSRNISSHIDVNLPVSVPVKTSSVMPGGDSLSAQHFPPPGLPPSISQNLLLTRAPVFPPNATVVGPPEVRPFTAQSTTSLVSQAASPPHSRALSPHQSLRPLAPACISQSMHPLQLIGCEPVQTAPTVHLDTNVVSPALGPSPQLAYSSPSDIVIKGSEDESHFISDEKVSWPNEQLIKNGLRTKVPYMPHEHLANLKLDSDKPPASIVSVHCANSTSSSCSSRNQSPTETPTVTPSVTPHGPGRGSQQLPPMSQQQSLPPPPPQDSKARVNGLPPPAFIAPPSEHQPPFSTVPYNNFPRYQIAGYPFRPAFPNSFPLPPNEMMYNYAPIYISSMPQQAPRNLNCCNCGSLGHTSVDCNAQSVEDITQTPYILDYESPTLPENPPEK